MVNLVDSPYTDKQIAAWLRGLLTIAWSDGDFTTEEQSLIAELTQDLSCDDQNNLFEAIEPAELAKTLGEDKKIGENFLRHAVLVAIADGIYSQTEANLLKAFSQALGLDIKALKSLEHTLCYSDQPATGDEITAPKSELVSPPHPEADLLHPIKDWLDEMDIHDPRLARFICKMVPPQCPFERDIELFGHKLVHIPPMCKLNPLYEQLVGLRFRSLSFLADDCKEDVSEYI